MEEQEATIGVDYAALAFRERERQPQGESFMGIVVKHEPVDRFGEEAEFPNLVYAFNCDSNHRLFHVHYTAFKLSADELAEFRRNDFDDRSGALKNAVRRRGEELKLGDCISFVADEGTHIIRRFVRQSDMVGYRAHGLDAQIKVDCVLCPTSSVVSTSELDIIPCSREIAQALMPDVACTGWATARIVGEEGSERLEIELSEVEGCDQEQQIHVESVFWRRDVRVDDYVDPLLAAESPNILKNLKGYLTGDRTIFCPDSNFREKVFAIPFIDKERMKPGAAYIFDAFFHLYTKCHIVCRYREYTPETPFKHVIIDGRVVFEVSAKQHSDQPMLWTTKEYGVLDDPFGVLALHHLTRYSSSVARVCVFEDARSSLGRFRIAIVESQKSKKIEKDVAENKRELKGLRGVIISRDGRVFCSAHQTLRFLPSFDTVARLSTTPLGTEIVFDAAWLGGPEYELTNATVQEPDKVKHFTHSGRTIFLTKASPLPRAHKLPSSLLASRIFGLLSDPLFRLTDQQQQPGEHAVWISESGFDNESTFRISAAPFFIVATGEEQPNLQNLRFRDAKNRDVRGCLRDARGEVVPLAEEVKEKARAIAGLSRMAGPKCRLSSSAATSRSSPSASTPTPVHSRMRTNLLEEASITPASINSNSSQALSSSSPVPSPPSTAPRRANPSSRRPLHAAPGSTPSSSHTSLSFAPPPGLPIPPPAGSMNSARRGFPSTVRISESSPQGYEGDEW